VYNSAISVRARRQVFSECDKSYTCRSTRRYGPLGTTRAPKAAILPKTKGHVLTRRRNETVAERDVYTRNDGAMITTVTIKGIARVSIRDDNAAQSRRARFIY